ncbi:Mucin-2 like [Actinidia chinensis var. chinensis]|uniref:Mucin-2 like n=1 Tax=Actinidia chinensis var. chinensis TaxID=1590841 RepID=A0A2R6PTG6_ACTCC|nr:Mucin-2 like [Actinidia chinensis var. chinensis]
MGKTGRDWTQIYAIYGMDDWQTPVFLLLHAIAFSTLSLLFLIYFDPICVFFESLFPGLPGGAARFGAGFTGSVTALSAVCLFFAAGNIFYSSVSLHWDMAQRMVAAVPDWSAVRHTLDVGCGGRGILLNSVAMQLKKAGSSGRVVGLDRRNNAVSTLRTAAVEGVQEYVTCREGDARRLPFGDGSFDVVVSAAFVHTVGKEFGPRTAAATAERGRVIGEVVRVLKPGGSGVVWDLVHVAEYVQRLRELKMDDIRVSERVTAFMVSSHIVSFRKPSHHFMSPGEVRLDWRFNNIC